MSSVFSYTLTKKAGHSNPRETQPIPIQKKPPLFFKFYLIRRLFLTTKRAPDFKFFCRLKGIMEFSKCFLEFLSSMQTFIYLANEGKWSTDQFRFNLSLCESLKRNHHIQTDCLQSGSVLPLAHFLCSVLCKTKDTLGNMRDTILTSYKKHW